jgi:hypothetical protein
MGKDHAGKAKKARPREPRTLSVATLREVLDSYFRPLSRKLRKVDLEGFVALINDYAKRHELGEVFLDDEERARERHKKLEPMLFLEARLEEHEALFAHLDATHKEASKDHRVRIGDRDTPDNDVDWIGSREFQRQIVDLRVACRALQRIAGPSPIFPVPLSPRLKRLRGCVLTAEFIANEILQLAHKHGALDARHPNQQGYGAATGPVFSATYEILCAIFPPASLPTAETLRKQLGELERFRRQE